MAEPVTVEGSVDDGFTISAPDAIVRLLSIESDDNFITISTDPYEAVQFDLSVLPSVHEVLGRLLAAQGS